VPGQESLGSDDGGDFTKDATAEHLGLGCQAAALIVVQTESFAPQVLPQYPVFFTEVVDRVALLLTQPSGDRNQQQSKRVEGAAHWASIAAKVVIRALQLARSEAVRVFGHFDIRVNTLDAHGKKEAEIVVTCRFASPIATCTDTRACNNCTLEQVYRPPAKRAA
jgi:hypothetical protein